MLNMSARRRSALLILLGSLAWILSACGAQDPLPTRVVAIATIDLSPEEQTAASTVGLVPATFTAAPTETVGPGAPRIESAGPTSTPWASPTVPTRTPTATSTATSTATATRYISVIPDLPPTDELGPSKLGLHVVRNNNSNIME
ncbi:MAG: hypothetical protein ACWGPS_11230, partial [Candidatus Promineifilaceae bacterium]